MRCRQNEPQPITLPKQWHASSSLAATLRVRSSVLSLSCYRSADWVLAVNGSLESLTELCTQFNQATLDSNVGRSASTALPGPGTALIVTALNLQRLSSRRRRSTSFPFVTTFARYAPRCHSFQPAHVRLLTSEGCLYESRRSRWPRRTPTLSPRARTRARSRSPRSRMSASSGSSSATLSAEQSLTSRTSSSPRRCALLQRSPWRRQSAAASEQS